MNFVKFLRTPIFWNFCEQLLLQFTAFPKSSYSENYRKVPGKSVCPSLLFVNLENLEVHIGPCQKSMILFLKILKVLESNLEALRKADIAALFIW